MLFIFVVFQVETATQSKGVNSMEIAAELIELLYSHLIWCN